MRYALLATVLALYSCAESTPYDDFAYQVKHDVVWVKQNVDGNPSADKMVFGCRAEGDCDDRALCAACRLIQQGANPDDITVVVQGWLGDDTSYNHMSIEYKGYCLLGYGSVAYKGRCEHPYADSNMIDGRTPLRRYINARKALMECRGVSI